MRRRKCGLGYGRSPQPEHAEDTVSVIAFETYIDVHGDWRWRMKAANGRIIADSAEGYRNQADCEHGIDLIKQNATAAPVKNLLEAMFVMPSTRLRNF